VRVRVQSQRISGKPIKVPSMYLSGPQCTPQGRFEMGNLSAPSNPPLHVCQLDILLLLLITGPDPPLGACAPYLCPSSIPCPPP
jgi:hypothetical protein